MDHATSLSLGRIAIGAAAWGAPELCLRYAMVSDQDVSPYLMRLFGARDVALGALTLFAAPERKSTLLAVGMAVDAADAAAGAIAYKSQSMKPVTAAAFTGLALVAVGAGVAALKQQR